MKNRKVDDSQIEIQRTPEFYDTAKQVSDLINDLHLPKEQNDRLIAALVVHVNAAEDSGFRFGFGLGLDYSRYEAAHKDDSMFQNNTPHLVS